MAQSIMKFYFLIQVRKVSEKQKMIYQYHKEDEKKKKKIKFFVNTKKKSLLHLIFFLIKSISI